MAHPGDNTSGNLNNTTKNDTFRLESEEEFGATSLSTNASNGDNATPVTNPTFMQNQISIQRSPSTAISQASLLSRKLSTKSNGSCETPGPSITGVLYDNGEQKRFGRGRGYSNSSLIEAAYDCSLNKSSSVSTNSSTKSVKSAKSVRSVHAVGNYPLGSLRVHSPSPARGTTGARGFLVSGDAVVVRDIPTGSLFGYDTRGFSIKAEEEFEGVKDIPPGAHFIWGGSSEASLRHGIWIMSSKKAPDEFGEVHVMRWDKENEVLAEEISAAEAMIQRRGIAEIVDKLQSYAAMITDPAMPNKLGSHPTPQMGARDPNIWHRLTSSMKGALLTKITGRAWNHWQVSSTHDHKPLVKYSVIVPENPLHKTHDEVFQFVFPKSTKTFSKDSSGRDRTEQALDTSSHVLNIIHGKCSYEDYDEIIGELQFCYITGMILGNLACMEHWAHILKVLFKAFRLVVDLPVFFSKVIEAVHAQFIYDHEGLDGSILDQDANLAGDLKMILTVFKSRLNELLMAQGTNITPDQQAVGKAFEALEAWLWKWSWDLRGNYVRSGQIQLEDGEFVDAELKDFAAEDERGLKKGKSRARHGSKSAGIVRWKF